MKSVTIQAETDEALVAGLESAARRIRLQAKGGNWKLAAMLKAKGLTVLDVSNAIQVTRAGVYAWIYGSRKRIHPVNLESLATFLQVPADRLGFTPRVKAAGSVKREKVLRGRRDRQLGQEAAVAYGKDGRP